MSKFRFAIMGAGGVSNHFCRAAALVDDCKVIAVASKSLEKARDFAKRNGVATAYDSYLEMLEKEKPDCVYIGTVPNSHFELAMLCLEHGVPVLCEKAMFRSYEEADIVFSYAKKHGLFVMEALWSRFLPAVNAAKKWLDEGRIGKSVFCDTSIGFVAPKDDSNRYFCKALGGGTAYDILVYAYELTKYMFPGRDHINSMDIEWGNTGVDITDHIVMRIDDVIATLTTSFVAPFDDRMVICGEKGMLEIPNPHFASEAFLYGDDKKLKEHFIDSKTIDGFTYEIEEVIRCIRKGKIESEVVPHQATLDCAKLFDSVMQSK